MSQFLPTTPQELKELGWDRCDVILISGDAYVDSPYIGVAVVGRILQSIGLRVGIIAQPELKSDIDIKRLGEPRLFWGVSGGSVDSMVANYTASKKFRKSDDYTPGGVNNRRPDRAVLAYTNLIRQYFKNTVPIVLGGIEASLRRITHYDYWDDKLRRPILFDSKADYIIYGMGENAIKELAIAIQKGRSPKEIRSVCYISNEPKDDFLQLPSHDECLKDKERYIDLFDMFYDNNDPLSAKGLCQKVDTRYLIQNPPCYYLNEPQMDEIASLPYTRQPHPYYAKDGKIKCLETIGYSITTHHGCWGECNFCAIGVHQGRTIRTRSEKSIISEVISYTKEPNFKGIINDLGGASANMYGYECGKKTDHGTCTHQRCVDNKRLCRQMKVDHSRLIDLMRNVRKIRGVKKAFVQSGIRYDIIAKDKKYGETYLRELVNHHISGQMKIAPEHTEDRVLALMGKPSKQSLIEFKRLFDKVNGTKENKKYLTYYLIAAHPGCDAKDMKNLKNFTTNELHINPEQAQIFTPTPGTYSAVMYYTGLDPKSKKPIFVEKNMAKKEEQKAIVVAKDSFGKSNFSN